MPWVCSCGQRNIVSGLPCLACDRLAPQEESLEPTEPSGPYQGRRFRPEPEDEDLEIKPAGTRFRTPEPEPEPESIEIAWPLARSQSAESFDEPETEPDFEPEPESEPEPELESESEPEIASNFDDMDDSWGGTDRRGNRGSDRRQTDRRSPSIAALLGQEEEPEENEDLAERIHLFTEPDGFAVSETESVVAPVESSEAEIIETNDFSEVESREEEIQEAETEEEEEGWLSWPDATSQIEKELPPKAEPVSQIQAADSDSSWFFSEPNVYSEMSDEPHEEPQFETDSFGMGANIWGSDAVNASSNYPSESESQTEEDLPYWQSDDSADSEDQTDSSNESEDFDSMFPSPWSAGASPSTGEPEAPSADPWGDWHNQQALNAEPEAPAQPEPEADSWDQLRHDVQENNLGSAESWNQSWEEPATENSLWSDFQDTPRNGARNQNEGSDFVGGALGVPTRGESGVGFRALTGMNDSVEPWWNDPQNQESIADPQRSAPQRSAPQRQEPAPSNRFDSFAGQDDDFSTMVSSNASSDWMFEDEPESGMNQRVQSREPAEQKRRPGGANQRPNRAEQRPPQRQQRPRNERPAPRRPQSRKPKANPTTEIFAMLQDKLKLAVALIVLMVIVVFWIGGKVVQKVTAATPDSSQVASCSMIKSTVPGKRAAALEALVSGPFEGLTPSSDSSSSGAIDYSKALRLEPDARQALSILDSSKFQKGYGRTFTGPDNATVTVSVYEFAGIPCAPQYVAAHGANQAFEVNGLPNAISSIEQVSNGPKAHVIRAAFGSRVLIINWVGNASTAPALSSALATKAFTIAANS